MFLSSLWRCGQRKQRFASDWRRHTSVRTDGSPVFVFLSFELGRSLGAPGCSRVLATTTGSEGTTAASDGGDDREFCSVVNAGVFLFRKITDVLVVDVDVHKGAELAVGGEEMLAHSRELLDQFLQTFSDSHTPHRHGGLLVRVGSKRSGDMDIHCVLLCRTLPGCYAGVCLALSI